MGKRPIRIIQFFLFWISIIVQICFVNQPSVYSADKLFTLSQAQNLALSKNKSYKRVKSKIAMQQVKYAAAVKSIQLKKKNMSTFRWTPLLSFKFPEKADLADEFQWQYKPLQIQNQISTLTHKLQDTKYQVLEKVSVWYVQAYTCQEKITFSKERMEALQDAIARNSIRVKVGEANQADVDKMQNSLRRLEKDISLYQRNLTSMQRKIGDLTGIDLTTGYRLTDPLVTAEIGRDMLEGLLEHTLEADQSYYEARMTTQLSLTSVNLNQSLMQKQYGNKMNRLKPYLDQAKRGEEIDQESFKSAYDQFLIDIDAPWQGKKKILFIRIPKEWFKGAISGVRYVEDDPYALYTAVLDYEDAFQEQNNLKKELTDQVSDSFETLVTARNAYQSLLETEAEELVELKQAIIRNQVGELSYQELKTLQESYEETQLACMDSLASYSELLYGFDRLTCGGITAYLKGESLAVEAVLGGDSFLEEETAEGAYYYIQTKVEDNMFVFGISIPEDFRIEITAYELWVDGTQIGERVAADSQIQHLALSLEDPQKVVVHLYQGETLVDEVEIDSQVYRGDLKIKGGYRAVIKEQEKKVAEYTYEVDSRLGLAILRFEPQPGEGIFCYQVTEEQGQSLYQDNQVPIKEEFRYLSVMTGDLRQLRVIFYDKQGQELYQGRLDQQTGAVMVMQE